MHMVSQSLVEWRLTGPEADGDNQNAVYQSDASLVHPYLSVRTGVRVPMMHFNYTSK